MKELKDFEEDLYKCSRCALCQSVCPVYKATLNECAVSKGKFNMLNGVLKGDLSVTKQMKKYLDMCTGCNACKKFCPSSIDAKQIINCAKNEYYKNNSPSIIEKTFNSYNSLKSALILAKPCFILYRLLHLNIFVSAFEWLLLRCGDLGNKILLLNFIAKSFSIKFKKRKNNQNTKTAIFFDGCVNKYINPMSERAVFKILNNSSYKIIKKNFECCGITFMNDGNYQEFQKIISKNLNLLPNQYDYVLTDCASCCNVLKNYKEYTDNPKAESLSEKTICITELLKNIKLQCKSKKTLKIAVHLPCHEDFDFTEIVKNIKGIEYIEAKDYDKCCGFAGSFAIKNPETSKKISMLKAQNYIRANADIVLTTCPSCMLGLEQGFIETKLCSHSRPKVMNLFVFIAKYCKTVS